MLNTGAMIASESGLRGLTVRGLSLRAGTNPGSFVYHFGNRDAFLNELLERWYEPLFTGVRTHANVHLPSLKKLEIILEDIMDFLLVIGAMNSKDVFEEVKIMRETRNDLNRANNAETANIARTISASMKTINNIIKIMDTVGLEILPVELRQIAQLRIANPDYSIQQIADSIEPPLTKSGVNHRLRKINKIADDL